MIVNRADDTSPTAATLDELFRRAAVRNADMVALVDPPDRADFTAGVPQALTYAQADRIVWSIAARLRALGLQTDTVVGLQLPNTVESVLAFLGVLRAGLIAAPLPMLWRETEIVAALSSVGAKALVTASRIGSTDHCALAVRVAARLFSVRHVCAFGDTLSDGVVPLDDVFAASPAFELAPPRDGHPAVHAAVVTFEPTPRGLQPVARSHMQLVAAGDAVMNEAAVPNDCTLLSAMPLSSFAGLSVTLLPWLLSGGRLALHQPFNPEHFQALMAADEADVVVLPGPLAQLSSERATTIAVWRAPERLEREPQPGNFVDITVFGEYGLHAARRGQRPARPALNFRCTNGTLALRGTMVAPAGFAAEAPAMSPLSDGFVDTGYPCRIDPVTALPVVTGPQPGMIGIGGYRIARSDIDALAATIPQDSQVAALPDALLGQRLRARAQDSGAAAAALAAHGANALVGAAFSGR